MTARAVPTSSPAPSTVTNFSFSWNHNDAIIQRYPYLLHSLHFHWSVWPQCIIPSILLAFMLPRTGLSPPVQPWLFITELFCSLQSFLLSPRGVNLSASLEIPLGGSACTTAISGGAALPSSSGPFPSCSLRVGVSHLSAILQIPLGGNTVMSHCHLRRFSLISRLMSCACVCVKVFVSGFDWPDDETNFTKTCHPLWKVESLLPAACTAQTPIDPYGRTEWCSTASSSYSSYAAGNTRWVSLCRRHPKPCQSLIIQNHTDINKSC